MSTPLSIVATTPLSWTRWMTCSSVSRRIWTRYCENEILTLFKERTEVIDNRTVSLDGEGVTAVEFVASR
jgi:hypothetical protein